MGTSRGPVLTGPRPSSARPDGIRLGGGAALPRAPCIPRAPAGYRALEAARRFIDRYGLILVLLAMPVLYGIKDLGDEGDLSHLATNLKDGVSNGAIWALIALGYTLVYGIIELINFAHGDLFMIGSFVAVGLFGTIGLTTSTAVVGLALGLIVVLLLSMLVCAALNAMIERVGYRPLRNAPKLAPLITAVGFSFILQNVGLLWLGGSQHAAPDLIQSQKELVEIAGVSIKQGDVLAIAATTPLLLALGAFVTRSRLGKAMRATAQDPEAARLMGINVDTTISFTFILGGLMAGAAGLIYALYQTTIWFFQGFTAGLIAFTAAVMGGIGNLQGAVLGGLIIGCIQQISDNRIGGEWTPAIVFAYLVLIMVLKPQGLLGEQTREAG
jgi:branched-chain amino acid transport system permease protein